MIFCHAQFQGVSQVGIMMSANVFSIPTKFIHGNEMIEVVGVYPNFTNSDSTPVQAVGYYQTESGRAKREYWFANIHALIEEFGLKV